VIFALAFHFGFIDKAAQFISVNLVGIVDPNAKNKDKKQDKAKKKNVSTPVEILHNTGNSVHKAAAALIEKEPPYKSSHDKVVQLLNQNDSIKLSNNFYEADTLIANGLLDLSRDCQRLSGQQKPRSEEFAKALKQLRNAQTVIQFQYNKTQNRIKIHIKQVENPKSSAVANHLDDGLLSALQTQAQAWGSLQIYQEQLLQNLENYSQQNIELSGILRQSSLVLKEAAYAMQMQGLVNLSEEILIVLNDLRGLLDESSQTRQQLRSSHVELVDQFRLTTNGLK